ncbi:conjugative transfer protein MobI(A/C) [Thiohalocapsa marina]|uniref:conjugative transfer protein MobI(A/C) n=1 Tax=Thiohalocapsa marina TaxID=424902 RepID=UPI0036DA4DFB
MTEPAQTTSDPCPIPPVTRQGAAHLDKWWAGVLEGEGSWSLEAFPELVGLGFEAERERLRLVAEGIEIETMERLRAQRLQRQRGRNARLGVRVRAPRRVGGSFTIEWFLARGPGRTQYLPRGEADAYTRSSLAAAMPWERDIALEAERIFGEIRLRLRWMKQAELRLQQVLARVTQPLPGGRVSDQSLDGAGAHR